MGAQGVPLTGFERPTPEWLWYGDKASEYLYPTETPTPEPTATPIPSPVPVPQTRGYTVQSGSTQSEFAAGYEARANGDPTLLSVEAHVVGSVIGCESGWSTDPGNPSYAGLAQFDWGTWAGARRSPEASPYSAWEQGWATANWISKIGIAAAGTRSGWPVCWWSYWQPAIVSAILKEAA